jgi:hypothetical protein
MKALRQIILGLLMILFFLILFGTLVGFGWLVDTYPAFGTPIIVAVIAWVLGVWWTEERCCECNKVECEHELGE